MSILRGNTEAEVVEKLRLHITKTSNRETTVSYYQGSSMPIISTHATTEESADPKNTTSSWGIGIYVNREIQDNGTEQHTIKVTKRYDFLSVPANKQPSYGKPSISSW